MKEEKIKVLALLPMELPKEIELDNTLEAMQKFVGGLIECITLSDTGSAVTLVCNDEGKLLGLPLNRPLWDGADVLAGPGFLAGCDNEGNLTSLPQGTMDFYKEKWPITACLKVCWKKSVLLSVSCTAQPLAGVSWMPTLHLS